MDATKRKALEAAGWKLGDAEDFLEMSDEERQLLDARVNMALAIKRQRKALEMSQKELGAILKTSQPSTLLGFETVNCWFKRFGAIGKLCFESVVAIRNLGLLRA
jgi:DNA-binding transcriptional regulator YiaG